MMGEGRGREGQGEVGSESERERRRVNRRPKEEEGNEGWIGVALWALGPFSDSAAEIQKEGGRVDRPISLRQKRKRNEF
jgi:hypothetical protein